MTNHNHSTIGPVLDTQPTSRSTIEHNQLRHYSTESHDRRYTQVTSPTDTQLSYSTTIPAIRKKRRDNNESFKTPIATNTTHPTDIDNIISTTIEHNPTLTIHQQLTETNIQPMNQLPQITPTLGNQEWNIPANKTLIASTLQQRQINDNQFEIIEERGNKRPNHKSTTQPHFLKLQDNDTSHQQRALANQDTPYGQIEQRDTTSGAVTNRQLLDTDTFNPTTNKTNDNPENSHNTTNTQTRPDTTGITHEDQSNNQNNYDKEEQQGQDTTGLEIPESTTTLSEISQNRQIENNNNNQHDNNKNKGKRTTIRIDDETPTQIRIQQTIPQYDTTPNRRNEPWGASIHNLPPTTFRIYFQNINGLQLKTNNSRWKHHLEYMKEKGISITGLAETNTNWHYKNIKKDMLTTTKSVFEHCSVAFSENRFNPPDRNPYLPGGCAQLCIDHWIGRLISQIKDPRKMGRWTGQKFRLRHGKTLSIITGYRPCQQTISDTSTTTATYQQKLLFKKDKWEKSDPRKQFIIDIIEEIKKIEEDPNNLVILMWDANESINDKSGTIKKIIRETTLVDAFSQVAGNPDEITTYSRGKKRIDYILTSQALVPYISRVGYLALYESNLSDHRGMFMDISDIILGTKVIPKRPAARHIGSKSKPNTIYKYKDHIHTQFVIHRIYERAEELFKCSDEEPVTEEYIIKLNNLDKQITEIMLSAEKKICPRQHESEWSVAIHQQSMLCKYWALVVKGTRNKIDTSRKSNEVFTELPEQMQNEILRVTHHLHPWTTRIECTRQLRLATKYHKQMLSAHRELRRQSLVSLQEVRKSEGNIEAAEIIRLIIRHEIHNKDLAVIRALSHPKGPQQLSKQDIYIKQWQTINPAFHSTQRSSLNTIEVPHLDANSNPTDDPDQAVLWSTISDPLEIEERLLARNIAHFGQAQGTLFTTEYLQQKFGYNGVTTAVEDLMKTPFDESEFPTLTTGATTLLNTISHNNRLPQVSTKISQEEFSKAFRKWSEGTSTSPSGRHLGHYRCLFADDAHTGYTDEEPDPSHQIMGVYFHVATAALNWGVSLRRWQNSITTMIEKQPGCPRINKLRVIHLYEADYNLLLKIIWARRLVWHVHDLNKLNEGQAGSRPGRNSIDVVIQKEMKYLYATLTRTGLATMDNDAKSCYDRIICNLAMIVSQFYGITKEAASTQAITLQHMCFRIRTALGDSQAFYKHSHETPIHGTGQGSCASPAIWLLVSSLLMDCLGQLGNGMTMTDVMGKRTLRQLIDGFVDDTSLFTNLLKSFIDSNDIETLTSRLRHDMVAWKELLEASGGKLELTKCFYYILTWKFDKKGNPIPTTIPEQRLVANPISIPDSDRNTEVLIQQKEISEAHKTLGCYKCIIRNEEAEILYLTTRSNALANMIKNYGLTKKQATLAYNLVYISSLKYGLPSTTLSYQQITNIHRYAVDKFISAMGIDHSTHRALIYGPSEYGGFGVRHLYTEMMGMKLETVISHIRSESQLGTLFEININYIQLLAGTGTPIFQSRDDLSYIPMNWILHLRQFLLEINAKLEIKDLWLPKKQCTNDQFLMTAFVNMKATRAELIILNNWRLYYKIILRSELCMASGQGIQPIYLEYDHESMISQSKSTLNWPIQGKPDKTSFSTWKRFIKKCFINPDNYQIQNFGAWDIAEVLWVSPRYGYYSNINKEIYIPIEKTFHSHKAFDICRRSARYDPAANPTTTPTLPDDVVPVDIQKNNESICFHFQITNEKIKAAQPSDENKWRRVILQHLQVLDMTSFYNDLHNDNITINIVSDGGVHQYHSNFGLVIASKSRIVAQNLGQIYSVEFHESSYRSELYGMLAAVVSFNHILEEYKITIPREKRINFFCDNKSVIKLINARRDCRRTINQHRYPDVDIEQQLMYELNALSKKATYIEILHVKGHQDKDTQRHLTTEEALNVEADELTHQARRLPHITTYTPFPTNKVNLVLNNQYINSHYPKMVNLTFHSMALREYYVDKHGWTTNIIDSIWWPVYFQSLSKLPDPDKLRVKKFINNRLPTLQREQKYYRKENTSGHCKQCKLYIETEDHIIRCRTPSRQKIRDEWRNTLTNFLSESHTPKAIRDALCHGFYTWLESGRDTTDIPPPPRNNSEVMRIYEAQTNIGWHHFPRGRLTIEWGSLINQHLATQPQHQFNAEHWGNTLLSINWKHILLMWNLRNSEVNGETPEKAENIRRQKMIDEILDIQSSLRDVSIEDSELINRDAMSLRTMTTTSLSTYLYGAGMLAESYRRRTAQEINRPVITNFFQPRQRQHTTADTSTANNIDPQVAI